VTEKKRGPGFGPQKKKLNTTVLKTPVGVKALCDAIEVGEYSVLEISKRQGFSMGGYYDLLRNDSEFESLIQDAYIRRRNNNVEKAETEGLKRIKGYQVEDVQTEEGVTSKGTISLTRTTRRHVMASDAFLMFLMKNGGDGRYTEKQVVEQVDSIKSKADYDAVLKEISDLQKKLGLDGEPEITKPKKPE